METQMQTKPKRNSIITTKWDQENGRITWTVLGVGDLTLDMTKLHRGIITDSAYHGMTQRISDAAAIPRDTATGRSATPREKFDAMRALVGHYETGTDQWRVRGEREDAGSLTIQAIMRVTGVDLAQAEETVRKLALARFEGERTAALRYLATGARVAEAMAKIRQERLGQAALDADSEIDRLMGE